MTDDEKQPEPEKPAEQKPAEQKPPVVALPGMWWADVAYKQGSEDEYIDEMRNRYGGEW